MLFITAMLFVSLELILRLIYPEKVIKSTSAYQFNPESLVSLKANITKIFERKEINGGDVITWKTNSHGFRGASVSSTPKFRIMVYGDSNIQARFSRDENTYPVKLQQYLNKEAGANKVEVINAGLVGAGPDQSLIRMKNDFEKFKPDLIILHVFADNDYGDILKNRLFNLNLDGSVALSGMKTSVDSVILERDGFKHFVSSLLLVKAARKIVTRTDNKQLTVKDILKNLELSTKEHYENFIKNGAKKASHFGDPYDLDVAAMPSSPSAITKIKLMRGILLQAKEFAIKSNVKLLVQIQPSVVDLSKNGYINYDNLTQYKGYKRTNLSSFIEEMCKSEKISYLNLYQIYSENKPESLYFKGDNNHWNDAGQDLAAKVSASYIKSNF